MPTKTSNRLSPKPVKRPQNRSWALNGWIPAAVGLLTAALTVVVGRHFLDVAATTLSGWTALFFLAVFLGLISENCVSLRSFVSLFQVFTILCGAVSSLTTLFLMHWSPTISSAASLSVAAAMFILTMVSGFQHRPSKPSTFSNKSLEHWAIRLDDLLKYELNRQTKVQLVSLIEALWNSPQDQGNFISVQNQSFEENLDALERSVRSKDASAIDTNLHKLAHCLNERNQLIHSAVHVPYRRLNSDMAVLTDKSARF